MTDKKIVLINQKLKSHQMDELRRLLDQYEVKTELKNAEEMAATEVIFHWNKKMTHLWEKDHFPNLKWVQVISAGVNYVPLEDFSNKGIFLSNMAGIHSNTISEHVIGMLLYHYRQVERMRENQKQKEWDQNLTISELSGKSLLIVGAGSIGRRLGEIAKVFHMHTIGVNRSGRPIEEMDEAVTQEEIDKVLGRSDIVVNILPGTAETEKFFSGERFAQMKQGALFINVGRGSSVDSDALLAALAKETVGFAYLDVFEEEPLPADSPLWEHEKVFISPHVSGTVEHFRDALYPILEENAKAYVSSGKPVVNVVDYQKNY